MSPRHACALLYHSHLMSRLLLLLCLLNGVLSVDFGLGDAILQPSSIKLPAARIMQDFVEFATGLPSSEDDEDIQPLEESSQPLSASSIYDRLHLSLSLPRNEQHEHEHVAPSKTTLRSTGTTIAGLVLKDQTVILGADTRATDDRMVADKYCEKIHRLTPQIFACGAGTSGDLEALTRQVRYSMHLQQLQEQSIGNRKESTLGDASKTTIHHICKFLKDHLYESGGALGVNLIIGAAGGKLVALHPHGSMEQVPFAALGSGGLAAMGVLEERYKPNLSLKQAMKLVARAIKAGIDNDLGSGSQVDLCILHKDGTVEYVRAAVPEQDLKTNNILVDAVGGVNGFGNLPYEQQRRRTLLLEQEADWDTVLGL